MSSELASIPCSSKIVRGTSDGVDRLSGLPDELLHHVMSFLPMPEVVRTSLLSPRWRHLWASTPFIRIDHQDFMDADKLEKFGDHLLLSRDSTTSLDEAWIFAHGAQRNKSSEWVRQTIMQKVRQLQVSEFCDGFNGYVCLERGTMSPSQHLKTIRLQSLLIGREFFSPLDYGCPVLEHLELEDSCLIDLKKISSSSLKVLRIIRCFIAEGLVICASNLTLLSILDPQSIAGTIVTRDLSSLVTASVSLRSKTFHHKENKIRHHRILDGLSHATTLELHAPLPELTFERGLRTRLVFSNLTNLVLGDWCMAANFYPLRRILHCSPKLKELSFKLEMEECSTCKDAESALPSTRGAPPSGSGSHPCIERIKIYCHDEEDPRVSALEQALVLIVGNVKISIDRH